MTSFFNFGGHKSFLWDHWYLLLDSWWPLPWVSKPGWIPHLWDFLTCAQRIPPIHLWCHTCWQYSSQHGRAFSTHTVADIFTNFLKIFVGHKSFLWGHWYPCFGLLVTAALGFKARMDSLACVLPRLHTMDSSDFFTNIFTNIAGSRNHNRTCCSTMLLTIWPLWLSSDINSWWCQTSNQFWSNSFKSHENVYKRNYYTTGFS